MCRHVAEAAELLCEPARAAILMELMNGEALPAGELARAANIAPQTASGHLAKLVQAQFITVERRGRHRYHRLACAEVAYAIEALLVVARKNDFTTASPFPRMGTLAHARTCYSHLAGWLGVRIADALQERGLLAPGDAKRFTVTETGATWFNQLDIDCSSNCEVARKCLDWTERRSHLAGFLGSAMYKRFVELRWLVAGKEPRAVRVTVEGKRELWKLLRIPIS